MDDPLTAGFVFLIGVVLAAVGAVRAPDIAITSFGFLTIIVAMLYVRPLVGPIGVVALGFVGIVLIALAALVEAVPKLSEQTRGLRLDLEAGSRRAPTTDLTELEVDPVVSRAMGQHCGCRSGE